MKQKIVSMRKSHSRNPPSDIKKWLSKKYKNVPLVSYWDGENTKVPNVDIYPEGWVPDHFVRVNFHSDIGWFRIFPVQTDDNRGNV